MVMDQCNSPTSYPKILVADDDPGVLRALAKHCNRGARDRGGCACTRERASALEATNLRARRSRPEHCGTLADRRNVSARRRSVSERNRRPGRSMSRRSRISSARFAAIRARPRSSGNPRIPTPCSAPCRSSAGSNIGTEQSCPSNWLAPTIRAPCGISCRTLDRAALQRLVGRLSKGTFPPAQRRSWDRLSGALQCPRKTISKARKTWAASMAAKPACQNQPHGPRRARRPGPAIRRRRARPAGPTAGKHVARTQARAVTSQIEPGNATLSPCR